ncbi:MAG: metallophosphoesterase family protein, partial [Oscillospiraceae bacterium]|nr:metallophosphoesterase family protein [Oscillospiraceae bacterium]
MRILVCSDSHGRVGRLLRAAERQPGAARVVFLGDGENDSDALARPGLLLTRVRGNCDFGSQLPLWERFSAGGRQVLCTHGHSSR